LADFTVNQFLENVTPTEYAADPNAALNFKSSIALVVQLNSTNIIQELVVTDTDASRRRLLPIDSKRQLQSNSLEFTYKIVFGIGDDASIYTSVNQAYANMIDLLNNAIVSGSLTATLQSFGGAFRCLYKQCHVL
jgi:hypothetical protein